MDDYGTYNMDWGAAASATAQLAGTVANAYMASQAKDDDRKFAEKMYNRQRADALADWNMVNYYNHPKNVMKRLAESGINPILAFGGNITSSADMPRASKQDVSYRQAPQFNLDALAIGKLMSDIALSKSQARKNNADADKSESETVGQTYENERLIAQSKYFDDMAAFDWHLKDWAAELADKEGKIKQLEYNLRLIRYAAETGKEINIGDFEDFVVASDTPAFKAFVQDIKSKELTNNEISARIKSLEKGVALTASEILLNVKRGENISQDTERIRLENNLRKNGLNPNDPVWMRMGVQMLAEYLGIDLNDVIDKYKNNQ